MAGFIAMLVMSAFLINSVFNFALGLLIARFLGPEGFGQYAIAAALAIIINTLFLDWIRLAATRFYTEKTRAEDPAVRGTLDAILAISSLGALLVSAALLAMGKDFQLAIALAAMTPLMGLCNGFFDYRAALLRANHDDRGFAIMMIAKNVLSLPLMVGGAWWFGSPTAVAAGFLLSVGATIMIAGRRLREPGAQVLKPDWLKAKAFFAYGFPVILALLIYYLIPLWNRAAVAANLGFAPSGQYSLAFDIAIRVVQTVGFALDIVLFRIALQKEDERGLEEARRQLIANMGVVIAVVASVVFGYWLVLPSFEATLAPVAFRGPFAEVTALLLPGIACYALIQFALTPVLQLARRTWPAVLSALLALSVNALLVLPLGPESALADFARAQSFAYGVALLAAALLALSQMKVLPRAGDLAKAAVTILAITLAVWPFRGLPPGPLPLLASGMAGGLAFILAAYAMNIGCFKDKILERLKRKPVAA